MGGNIMKTLFTVIFTLILTSSVFAQDKPTLSETEQLKIQVLSLQYALRAEQSKSAELTTVYGQCQATLVKNSSDLEKLTSDLQAEIEKNHPDFTFDIRTGEFKKKD